jgi:dTMP kinase
LNTFITLEGPEGGGKTSQAIYLADHLRSKGFDVLLTREPGGTAIGEQVRAILTRLDNTEMNPRAEFLLFSSARAQIVHETIKPHLDSGGVVICDRFFDASLAYQGYGHQLDLNILRAITDFATAGLVPDLTLLLDLSVEKGLRRREQGGNWNRLDAYDLDFHQRGRDGYHALAKLDPQRWVVIDASQSFDQVQGKILREVDQRLSMVDRE